MYEILTFLRRSLSFSVPFYDDILKETLLQSELKQLKQHRLRLVQQTSHFAYLFVLYGQ